VGPRRCGGFGLVWFGLGGLRPYSSTQHESSTSAKWKQCLFSGDMRTPNSPDTSTENAINPTHACDGPRQTERSGQQSAAGTKAGERAGAHRES
jgi:hypothetical protein